MTIFDHNRFYTASTIQNYLLDVVKEQHYMPMINHLDDHPLVDIIIPIYNCYNLAKDCVEAVFDHSDFPYNLYLINDGSTDRNLLLYLNSLHKQEKPRYLHELEIIENVQNCGFVKSINKGITRSKNHPILLNSDTIVPKNWLSRLITPILLNKQIASVTPFSNNGFICSFPSIKEKNRMDRQAALHIDELFLKYGTNKEIEIPTGVGFCLALNRTVIDEIGIFDPVFGMGYGEENDWCRRAVKAGYKNVLAANVFVFHKGEATFHTHLGKEKYELQKKNLYILKSRHPEYPSILHRFIHHDPLMPLKDVMVSLMQINKEKKSGLLMIVQNKLSIKQTEMVNSLQFSKRIYLLEVKDEYMMLHDYTANISFSAVIKSTDINERLLQKLLSMFQIKTVNIMLREERQRSLFLELLHASNKPINIL